MNSLALFAIIFMVIALFSYTISIWGARRTERLKRIHVALSWIGLLFDITGSIFMLLLAGGLSLSLHTILGLLAIALMFANALWNTALFAKPQKVITRNHKYASLIIWAIWIISFFLGTINSM